MAATASTRPPFRADHVGSLLRPKELREAFRKYGTEPVASPAFVDIQERAIRDVVKLQEDAGLQVVTDGEFRRSSYWGRFVAALRGLRHQAGGVQVPRRSRSRGRLHGDLCQREARSAPSRWRRTSSSTCAK